MSNVPLARMRLAEMRTRLATLDPVMAAELTDVLGLLHRRPYARPASPVRSAVVDPQLAEKIRRYARANPEDSQQDIAVHFGTNHGRVSEALQRDR